MNSRTCKAAREVQLINMNAMGNKCSTASNSMLARSADAKADRGQVQRCLTRLVEVPKHQGIAAAAQRTQPPQVVVGVVMHQ